MRPRNLFDSTPLYPVTTTVPRGDVILKKLAKLMKSKKFDRVRTACYFNTHLIKLKEGREYYIDMSSRFDTYLRLETADGKQVANDDDSGRGRNARIVFRAPKDGEYRIIATSFKGKTTGSYKLTVYERDPSGGR